MPWLKKYGIQLLISAMLWLLLWLSIPIKFNRYFLENTGRDRAFGNSFLWADMDGDGADECISCLSIERTIGQSMNGCSINKLNGTGLPFPLDQINIKGELTPYSNAFDADINHNNIDELYIFEAVGTDIWLNGYEYPGFSQPFVRARIDSFIPYRGQPDFMIALAFTNDEDGDKIDELFFFIRNSFFIYPRRLYKFNTVTQELRASPSTCMEMGNLIMTKHGNGSTSISGNCGNSANYKDSLNIPYSDYQSYAYILDQDLNFRFKPIPISAYPYGTSSCIYNEYLYSAAISATNKGFIALYKLTLDGVFLDSLLLPGTNFSLNLHHDNLLLRVDQDLFKVDESLNKELLIEFKGKRITGELYQLDLDDDNQYELVFETISEEVGVISSDYGHLTFANWPFAFKGANTIGIQRFEDLTVRLVQAHSGGQYYYQYSANPYYWLHVPYIFGLGLLASLLTFLAFGIFKHNIEKRHKQELEMSKLQMLAIKNQIDPHFTLNALNSIDFMYQSGEMERAGKYMTKLSRLVHQTLMNSDKMTCTLYEELDFIRTYCQLEELRATYTFTYQIKVDEDVDTLDVLIPKQLIFTHVENAIKHGLRPKGGSGLLEINTTRKEGNIEIEIFDNGIGLKKSKQAKTTGTGKGLEILSQMIKLYQKLVAKKIRYTVETSKEGTRVIISLHDVLEGTYIIKKASPLS